MCQAKTDVFVNWVRPRESGATDVGSGLTDNALA
jgi:hypothetical protein